MKTKYIINGGLAFTEKRDIKKLEKLATEGWIFEKFAWAGFYYKLVKGPKQELTYTMDFQSNPATDYFKIFNSAGWTHVTSSNNQIHVFSAPKGTAPIYSEDEINEGKYKDITMGLGKGALYAFMALAISFLTMKMLVPHFEVLYYPVLVITFICLVAFVFSFMPYVAYKLKQKKN